MTDMPPNCTCRHRTLHQDVGEARCGQSVSLSQACSPWHSLSQKTHYLGLRFLIFVLIEGVSQLLRGGTKGCIYGKCSEGNDDCSNGNDKNCCRLHKISFLLKHCNLIIFCITPRFLDSPRSHFSRVTNSLSHSSEAKPSRRSLTALRPALRSPQQRRRRSRSFLFGTEQAQTLSCKRDDKKPQKQQRNS